MDAQPPVFRAGDPVRISAVSTDRFEACALPLSVGTIGVVTDRYEPPPGKVAVRFKAADFGYDIPEVVTDDEVNHVYRFVPVSHLEPASVPARRPEEVYPVRTYRVADCAVFCKTRDANGGCSNMAAGFPLLVNGIAIRTSEALYQAMRFPHWPEMQEKIIAQASPMAAKAVCAPFREERSRPDWMEVRVPLMAWVLRVKLIQNFVSFGDVLLATGGRPIVEQSFKDDFWGAMPCGAGLLRGRNVLGRLLDELYAALVADPMSLTRVEPPVSGMLLMGQPITTIELTEDV